MTSPDTPTRLHLRGITRSFGERAVLCGVDLRVEAGEILGLLGPNGAGKSTLIGIADGSLHPDAGSVTVDGIDLATQRQAALRLIGSAPQALGIYPPLTVAENVRDFARLHGLRGTALRRRSDEVIASLGLESSAAVRAENLSGGQKRRLHLAMALAHRPRLLFLDEPTVGADVESRQQILDVVARAAADGAAVVYTTHYLNELEQLPSRIALLSGGTVRDLGPVAEVVQNQADGALRVRVEGDVTTPVGWTRDGDWFVGTNPRSTAAEQLVGLIDALGEQADALSDVQLVRPSLEAAYLRLLHRPATPTTEAEHAAA